MTDETSVEVTDNPDKKRYEAWVGGELAGFAAYIPAEGMLVLSHTEVEEAHEGQGIGSALARTALDDLRARDLKVMATCPFMLAWIRKHPDYGDLLFNAPASRVSD